MAQKFGNICGRLVDGLFLLLMFCIAVATVMIDKNINSSFPNTVKYANGGYYMFALFALAFIFWLLWKYRGKHMSTRALYCSLAIMFTLTAALEYLIASWMFKTGKYDLGGDFDAVVQAAMGLAQGKTFADFPYFSIWLNNANIAMLLSLVYRVFPDWQIIAWLGALCTGISALLAALTVYNVTANEKAAALVGGGVWFSSP